MPDARIAKARQGYEGYVYSPPTRRKMCPHCGATWVVGADGNYTWWCGHCGDFVLNKALTYEQAP